MTEAAAARAGRREWVALAVIALPCLLYSMDLSVLYLALPSLAVSLKPSSAGLLWITDSYGFMLAGFLVTTGSVLLALGVSPAVTLATDLIVGAVPPERAGVASGLSETGTELGGSRRARASRCSPPPAPPSPTDCTWR
jgi:DHA2 family multidrug resistance protein-like MFS transporter